MTPRAFVTEYMALVDAYTAMSPSEREDITTEFVRQRSVREAWPTLVEEDK